MSRKIIHWVTGQAQTVGAVAVTVVSFDLADANASPDNTVSNNCAVQIEASIVGKDAASNDVGHKQLARGFKRIAGVLSTTDATVITAVNGLLQGQLATAAFDLDVSGTIIRLRVTGVATRTIDWFGDIRIRILEP